MHLIVYKVNRANYRLDVLYTVLAEPLSELVVNSLATRQCETIYLFAIVNYIVWFSAELYTEMYVLQNNNYSIC